jgi:hypothetical protein
MLSQPPSLNAFTAVGIEVWPFQGDGLYVPQILASIDNLTVTPVPLPGSAIALLSGMLLLTLALRRSPDRKACPA